MYTIRRRALSARTDRDRYTDDSLVNLITHEFSPVLGLQHNDEPQEVMNGVVDLTRLPKPDATGRDLPWKHSTLTVAVDRSNVPANECSTVKNQINEALEYYDNGADGTILERVSFRRVDNPETADITIRFSANSPSLSIDERGTDSCHIYKDINIDNDISVKDIIDLDIVLTNFNPETVA